MNPDRSAPTIDDVAAFVGVGRATVSRALRGLPEVAPATRAKVEQAARTLGYIPSASAARLAGGHTGSVAIVVPRITRWFYATVIEVIEDSLQAAGLDMLLYNLGGQEERRRQLLQSGMLRQRADAVVLVATPLSEQDIGMLTNHKVRGVTVSSGTAVPGWSSVRIDDAHAGGMAVDHLLSLGHRRIAHISGPVHHPLASTTHLDRRAAFEVAVKAAGGLAYPTLDDPGLDFTLDGGVRATRSLLAAGQRPTAIFAASDEMAMGAILALREAMLRVPEDVSVIGIDNHPLSPAVGLTTVDQDTSFQAEHAARMVLACLQQNANHDRAAPEMLILPTRLILRATTAGPPPG